MLRPRRAIGLDVGAGGVKLVEARRRGRTMELVRVQVEDLPSEAEVGDAASRARLVGEALDRLVGTGPRRPLPVTASLPGHAAFVRFLTLPRVAHQRASRMVRFEAQQQIPFALDDVVWDFHLVDQAENPDLEVVLVAMKRALVTAFLRTAEDRRIHVGALTVSPLALQDLAQQVPEAAGQVVLDVGAASTHLLLVDGGRCWARSILLGGRHLTEALRRRLGTGWERAETVKRGLGVVETITPMEADQAAAAVRDFVTEFGAEVAKSIAYYRAQYGREFPLTGVLLTGGAAQVSGFEGMLQATLQVPVRRLGWGPAVTVRSGLTIPDAVGQRLAVAIGLAVRPLRAHRFPVNLLPREERVAAWFRAVRVPAIAAAVAVMVGCLTATAGLQGAARERRRLLAQVAAQVDEARRWTREVDEAEQAMAALRQDVAHWVAVGRGGRAWLDGLAELSRVLPANAWVVRIGMAEGKVLLEGKTRGDFSSVVALREALEASPVFEAVEVVSATAEGDAPSAVEAGVRGFSLRLHLSDPGARARWDAAVEAERAAMGVRSGGRRAKPPR